MVLRADAAPDDRWRNNFPMQEFPKRQQQGRIRKRRKVKKGSHLPKQKGANGRREKVKGER